MVVITLLSILWETPENCQESGLVWEPEDRGASLSRLWGKVPSKLGRESWPQCEGRSTQSCGEHGQARPCSWTSETSASPAHEEAHLGPSVPLLPKGHELLLSDPSLSAFDIGTISHFQKS